MNAPESSEAFGLLSSADMRAMLHELRLQQIELEMRNERLRRMQHYLAAEKSRYSDLYDTAPMGYCTLDADARILQANLTAGSLLGLPRDALALQPLARFILMEDQGIFCRMRKRLDASGSVQNCELRLMRRDGTSFWAQLAATRVANGEAEPLYRVMLSDITERKQIEGQVRYLAFHDALTGLPNRRLLDDRMVQAMAQCKRNACHGAVILLDLDNFKPLNDRYGHAVGDLLLAAAADRLKTCVREMDTVARFGGDEFVVIISELKAGHSESTVEASLIAEKIRATLSQPYRLTVKHEGKPETTVEHSCAASIGVALFGDPETSQDDILKWADTAMYQAKEAGRNAIRHYHPCD